MSATRNLVPLHLTVGLVGGLCYASATAAPAAARALAPSLEGAASSFDDGREYVIRSRFDCPRSSWCDGYLSWDSAADHPRATVEHDDYAEWRFEAVGPNEYIIKNTTGAEHESPDRHTPYHYDSSGYELSWDGGSVPRVTIENDDPVVWEIIPDTHIAGTYRIRSKYGCSWGHQWCDAELHWTEAGATNGHPNAVLSHSGSVAWEITPVVSDPFALQIAHAGGPIVSDHVPHSTGDSLCVTADGPHARATVARCTSIFGQDWFMTANGEIRSSKFPGSCLHPEFIRREDIWNGTAAWIRQPVMTRACGAQNEVGQRSNWRFWERTPQGNLKLKSRQLEEAGLELCIDIPRSNTTSAQELRLYDCMSDKPQHRYHHLRDKQQWNIAKLPWQLIHDTSPNRAGNCLDGTGDIVESEPCDPTKPGQYWLVRPEGEVRNGRAFGQCLTVAGVPQDWHIARYRNTGALRRNQTANLSFLQERGANGRKLTIQKCGGNLTERLGEPYQASFADKAMSYDIDAILAYQEAYTSSYQTWRMGPGGELVLDAPLQGEFCAQNVSTDSRTDVELHPCSSNETTWRAPNDFVLTLEVDSELAEQSTVERAVIEVGGARFTTDDQQAIVLLMLRAGYSPSDTATATGQTLETVEWIAQDVASGTVALVDVLFDEPEFDSGFNSFTDVGDNGFDLGGMSRVEATSGVFSGKLEAGTRATLMVEPDGIALGASIGPSVSGGMGDREGSYIGIGAGGRGLSGSAKWGQDDQYGVSIPLAVANIDLFVKGDDIKAVTRVPNQAVDLVDNVLTTTGDYTSYAGDALVREGKNLIVAGKWMNSSGSDQLPGDEVIMTGETLVAIGKQVDKLGRTLGSVGSSIKNSYEDAKDDYCDFILLGWTCSL